MLPSSSSSTGSGMPPLATTQIIQSRFGEITVDAGKSLVFPGGLLGLPDKQHYVLAEFPSEKMKQFTLLQSLDEKALSFITLPLPADNAIIAAADIKAVCREFQIAEANLGLLLIVTVHRSPNEVKLSVNTRAPLFIDTARKLGTQHVMPNDQYSVQHMLG